MFTKIAALVLVIIVGVVYMSSGKHDVYFLAYTCS